MRQLIRIKIGEVARKAGVTKTEMACAVGVDYKTICRWATGESLPSRDNLAVLVAYLNQFFECHPADLFEW